MASTKQNGYFHTSPPKTSISHQSEILGGGFRAQFRYHRESFQLSLAIAGGLTILVCGLVWLLLGIYGTAYLNWITTATGIVFFAFMSWTMLRQYFRNEVVLAVQPTGLFDGRIANDTIAWNEIKELVLLRREQDYRLRIVCWPKNNSQQVHEVDLSVLEGGSEPILNAIRLYMPVRLEWV